MAAVSALLSGGWRVSSTSNLIQQTFSNLVTCSAVADLEFVVLPNVSDFVVSLAQFSNMQIVGLQANNVVRVNFGNVGAASYVSNASAGFPMTQFVWMGSGISGPQSLRFSNSGADSSTVRILVGM